jgi:DNA-binding SARP family transcriptional activator
MDETGSNARNVRLRTFGGLTLLDDSGHRVVDADNLRRPLLVLVVLAVAGAEGMSRDKLCAFLSPESDTSHSRNILKQYVFRLRRALNRSDVISGTTELRLNPDAVSTDVGDFLTALGVGDRNAAVQLYLGPFLDGVYFRDAPEFGRWAEAERARFARLAEKALRDLASKAEADRDFNRAADLWRRLAELQPADRQAALGLIRSLASAGEPHKALDHARVHTAYLRSQLEVEPDPELLAYVDSLKADRARRGTPTAPMATESKLAVASPESRPPLPPSLGDGSSKLSPHSPRPATLDLTRVLVIAVIVVIAILAGLRVRHLSGMIAGSARSPSAMRDLRELSAQGDATCASNGSRVVCWGRNDEGQLGNGSAQDALGATAVVDRADSAHLQFASVSVGMSHACALTSAGDAYCWGQNDEDQLGLSGVPGSAAPMPAAGKIRFTQISSGVFHTCGIATTNLLYCWGWNNYGQLGNPDITSRAAEAVRVRSDLAFSVVSSNYLHNCALTTDGSAYCWGSNVEGQVGTGDNVRSVAIPTLVTDARAFAKIVTGNNHTCALDVGGEALCWGYNAFGQLGMFTSGKCGRIPYQVPCSPRPLPIRTNLRFTELAAGQFHTCGLVVTGEAYCWGRNDKGQLGDGNASDMFEPVAVVGGFHFIAITAGAHHTCGISKESRIYCWGANDHGQLGDGTRSSSGAPVEVRLEASR